MATAINGENTQVGTSDRQIIETVNSNNNITININVTNCANCHQHQHQESLSVSGGDVHLLMDSVKSIAASCGQTTQPRSEPATTSQCEPTTREQRQVINKKRVKLPGPSQNSSLKATPGDGYIVRYDKDSKIVVKEKMDILHPFIKLDIFNDGDLNEYPREQRVRRALRPVGRPCPVPGGSHADFVFWTFTGLSYEQSKKNGVNHGFKYGPWSKLMFLRSCHHYQRK